MSPPARRRLGLLALALLGLVLAWWIDGADPGDAPPAAPAAPADEAHADDPVARGAYLALAGHCAGCHTPRGGPPYAGGRAIETPFGAIRASNLTPDPQTGLGAWTLEDFRRAMRDGVSRDGRPLYPAFPYPYYTRMPDADIDALWAWLCTLPPVHAPGEPSALRFPWNLRPLLWAWRALYFRPARYVPDPARDAAWNRGAYLVTGPGHCGACHTASGALGGPAGLPLGGAAMTAQGWYAPSLRSDAEGGVAGWPVDETAAWLAAGLSPRAVATGPMADVVVGSLQHLTAWDRQAMAIYLQSISSPKPGAARAAPAPGGPSAATRAPAAPTLRPPAAEPGEALYRQHCEDCHGAAGEGAPPHYPALAGNRSVMMDSPVNAIRIVLHGGFSPGTRDHPRPYGMPPFGPQLENHEVAELVGWLRRAWGHPGGAVSPRQVDRLRPVPVQ